MKINATITAKTAHFVLSAVAILGGATILILANVQSLLFFNKGMPGSGFFPTLCGVGIILCGIGNLITTIRRVKEKDVALEENLINANELKNFAFVIGLSIFTLVAYRWIGFLVTQFVVVLVVCRFLSKEPWLKSIIIAAGTLLIFYLVFVTALGIPMPISLIGV